MEIKPISKTTKIAVLAAAIITGVLFCCLGITMFNVLFTIIGAVIALGGLLLLPQKQFIFGILTAGLGALIIVAAWKWTNVAYIIFGVLMLISAIGGFIDAVMKNDVRSTVSSFISAILGGFLIGFREGADWMIFVIGALFIVLGVVGLLMVLFSRKKGVKTVDVKDIKEGE